MQYISVSETVRWWWVTNVRASGAVADRERNPRYNRLCFTNLSWLTFLTAAGYWRLLYSEKHAVLLCLLYFLYLCPCGMLAYMTSSNSPFTKPPLRTGPFIFRFYQYDTSWVILHVYFFFSSLALSLPIAYALLSTNIPSSTCLLTSGHFVFEQLSNNAAFLSLKCRKKGQSKIEC